MSENSLRNHFEVQITLLQRIERIFVFALILTPSFLGYFFVPSPLGYLKRVSADVFGSTDSIGSLEKNICFRPKIDFLPRGKPTALGKNEQILKNGIFHSFMSLVMGGVGKFP